MSERLAVDFDNTLTESNVEYWNGERPEPDEAVCQAVREHYRAGGTVIVWTARPWREAGRIAAHLTEWEVPYHGIRCEKGSADLYVDDKAVRPATFADGPGEADCSHADGGTIVDRPGAAPVCTECGDANPDGYDLED